MTVDPGLERSHDIVDVLQTQHRRMRQLLGQVQALRGYEKADAFLTLLTFVDRHESAEQSVVHPAVRDAVTGGIAIADEQVAEEGRIEMALARLEQLDVDAPSFDDDYAVFREAMLAHMAIEDATEISRLRDVLSAEQREHLGREFNTVQLAMI
jgi:hypothetical protein